MLKVITTHTGADFDAIGSLLAASKLYPDALLFLPGSPEKKVRQYLMEKGFPGELTKFKAIEKVQERIQLLIVVDTRYRSRLGRLADLIDKNTEIHIYDHHPKTENDLNATSDTGKEYGATTTILVEQLIKEKIPITSDEATLITMGIYEDTGCLTYPLTTSKDLKCVSFLLSEGADLKTISRYVIQTMNERQVWLLNELLQSKSFLETPAGRVAILEAEIDDYIEDLAVVVHSAMDIIKPDALFTLIKIGGKVLCISRSTIKEIDVGDILSRFGGGGHPTAASATFPIGIKEVKKNLKESIMKITKHSRLIKHPARVIPLTDTAAEAYHTLSHLSLDYAPVGDEEGNISGVVERSELKKAVRHSLGSHSVMEFISGSVPSIDESKSPGEIAKLMASSGFPFLILTKDNKISAVVDNKEEDDKKFPFIEISRQQIITKLDQSLESQIHDIIKVARDTAIEMGIAAYCVGGMVRDILMELEHKDIDIVVEKNGIEFGRKIAQILNGHIATHERFNTAVIKLKDRLIDIVTLRKEYYEFPGALPRVAEGTVKQDLYRRDFTINAMAIQIAPLKDYGRLIDYFGGMKDIKRKKISILYPLSFIEDPTRIFRAVRFEKRFNFTFSKNTIAQLESALNMDTPTTISGDRVKEELLLIMKESCPHEILLRLDEIGALKFIHPDLKISGRIYNAIKTIKCLSLSKSRLSPLIIMILLSEMDQEKAVNILKKFHFPKKLILTYKDAIKYSSRIKKLLSREISDLRIYKVLKSFDRTVLLYTISVSSCKAVSKKIIYYLTELKDVKTFINGRILKEMGYKPGPLYSKILFNLKLAKISGKVSNYDDEKKFINS